MTMWFRSRSTDRTAEHESDGRSPERKRLVQPPELATPRRCYPAKDSLSPHRDIRWNVALAAGHIAPCDVAYGSGLETQLRRCATAGATSSQATPRKCRNLRSNLPPSKYSSCDIP